MMPKLNLFNHEWRPDSRVQRGDGDGSVAFVDRTSPGRLDRWAIFSVPPLISSTLGVRRVPVPGGVIVVAVRWYLRYGLSYRGVEELLAERGSRWIT